MGGRLLDIGCGYGFFLKIAEEKGWEAVGVDLDPKGVAYAKERLRVNAFQAPLCPTASSDPASAMSQPRVS